jgi:hypothetical protein
MNRAPTFIPTPARGGAISTSMSQPKESFPVGGKPSARFLNRSVKIPQRHLSHH